MVTHARGEPGPSSAYLEDLVFRKAEDFRAGHIDGAINIPHGELRQRYGEVPRDAVVAVTCYAGIINRVDSRRLAREGYDVVRVEGGMKGWKGELKRQ